MGKEIRQLPEITDPSSSDLYPIQRASDNQTSKVTGSNLLPADSVASSKMLYGMVRNRQGGTTGDNSWYTTGTSNTNTDAKDAFWQVGSKATSGDTTVTFPTTYNQVPVVYAGTATAAGFNVFTVITNVTTTGFTYRQIDAGGAARDESIMWMAVGQ